MQKLVFKIGGRKYVVKLKVMEFWGCFKCWMGFRGSEVQILSSRRENVSQKTNRHCVTSLYHSSLQLTKSWDPCYRSVILAMSEILWHSNRNPIAYSTFLIKFKNLATIPLTEHWSVALNSGWNLKKFWIKCQPHNSLCFAPNPCTTNINHYTAE